MADSQEPRRSARLQGNQERTESVQSSPSSQSWAEVVANPRSQDTESQERSHSASTAERSEQDSIAEVSETSQGQNSDEEAPENRIVDGWDSSVNPSDTDSSDSNTQGASFASSISSSISSSTSTTASNQGLNIMSGTQSTSSNPNTLTIAGETIEVEDQPRKVHPSSAIVFGKKERQNMSEKDRFKLFGEFVQQNDAFTFDTPAYAFNKVDSMGDTYTLQNQVTSLREHIQCCDMGDVFNIVIYDDANPKVITKIVNLFDDYSMLTINDVARSNKWYRTMPKDNQPWFTENLRLMSNNMEAALHAKSLETYNEYHFSQQGGPLMFFIMMKHLSVITQETANHFKYDVVAELSLIDYDGEDVPKCVSHLRAAEKFINSVPSCQYGDGEFAKQVIRIMKLPLLKSSRKISYKSK